MPEGWPNEPIEDVAARRDALRHAIGVPGADAGALLEAALTELDGAIDSLAAVLAGGTADTSAPDGPPDAMRAERRLLHAAFQQAPVALFLLEQDGTIRRANNMAAALTGSPAGYATGKPLTAFLDMPSRAAVQTQLAAVARTGRPRQTGCRLLTQGGTINVTLTAAMAEMPGDPPLLVVTTSNADSAAHAADRSEPAPDGSPDGSADGSAPAPKTAKGAKTAKPSNAAEAANAKPANTAKAANGPNGPGAAGQAIAAMTRRTDMITSVTKLLLDNSTFSEAVTLQRCARLLAEELADWVVVDVERAGVLRRQFAAGPRNRKAEDLARAVRDVDPGPDSLSAQVHAARRSVLLAHTEDPGALGAGPGGVPLLMKLGTTSLICVPISDGTTSFGALTLARLPASGQFEISDLSLAERLGEHLAVAIRVDRMFRHRSEVAETLQASLLPARLPVVPGLEFAAAYIGATQSQEISGDFYDVFRSRDGWAIAIGDVCGKGQDAAAMTAAARHSIRALANVRSEPDDVLAAANEVLLAGDYGERFVTVKLAFLKPAGRKLTVQLASSGHPGPAVVRADGRVELLEGDGLPLGLFGDAHPNRADLELDDGDLLFFYTDGVTEARSANQEFFEDRLTDGLSAVAGRNAAETVRAVQELVTTFSRGELRDDVTILAVKVGGEGRPGS